MFEDDFPHPIQRYRTTPAREPFLITDRKPQNPHFFSHILQVYLKYSRSMAQQRAKATISGTLFFLQLDTSQTEQASVHRTGSSSSRIGAYCVEHLKSKHKVRFHHWKDTEVYWPHSAPERIRANRYFLRYDSKTGKPLSLGVTTWAARPANPLQTLWGIVWLRIVDLLRFVRTGSLPKAQIHILALEMYKFEER